MGSARDVLNLAASQLGVREVPDGSNRVPYSQWYGLTGAWCCMFVSWCLYHNAVPFGSGKGFAWVSGARDWLDRTDTPGHVLRGTGDVRPGDLLFFEWGTTTGGYDHIGFAESVDANYIYTIEGNTSNKVMRHRRPRWSGIPEIGRPAYSGGGGGGGGGGAVEDPLKKEEDMGFFATTHNKDGRAESFRLVNGELQHQWADDKWVMGPWVPMQRDSRGFSPGSFTDVSVDRHPDGRLTVVCYNRVFGTAWRRFQWTPGGKWSDWAADYRIA